MITKTKKVYYCEFCKKHGLRKDMMERHEQKCTMNPDRVCGLCGYAHIDREIKKYTEAYTVIKETSDNHSFITERVIWHTTLTLKDLRNEVECPICMLTVIRQAKLNKWPQCSDFYGDERDGFDYKKELQEWRDEENSVRDEGDPSGQY